MIKYVDVFHVKDKLPDLTMERNSSKFSEDVLAILVDGSFTAAFVSKYKDEDCVWCTYDDEGYTVSLSGVTHWMEVPKI